MQVQDDLQPRLIAMIEALVKAKGLTPEPIVPATTFASLQIDSLDKINLSFDLEEAYGIEIPDSAIDSIRTVADMIEGVQGLVAARAA